MPAGAGNIPLKPNLRLVAYFTAQQDHYHQVGLDYVSCSPFRVPVARLAAAQAVLEDGRE